MTSAPKYEIGALLGRGGMAETFEATRIKDNGPGFRVALKQVLPELLGYSPAMREEFLARFSREARIGAKLDHPNIVRVVDSGVLDGRPYMAMQLIEGVSLAALIRTCADREMELPPTVLTHIACDLGAALEYAHRHHVLHRDVSPGNVLLSDAGQCRLSDFGVARLVTEDLGLTRTKAFMGKVPYVAPETFHGMADELSDVYSLGVALTEAAIGRRLFPSATVHESMAARVQTDVHGLLVDARRDLPAGFAEMLTRLTSHDRNERPSTDEALTRFERMAGSTTSTAEHQLAELVKMASEALIAERHGCAVEVHDDTEGPPSDPGTATLVADHHDLVRAVVRATVSEAASSADLIEELLAAGNLGLVEAKRDYDPNNASSAAFSTFALPRVRGAVIEALAVFRGVSRGAYRAARRDAAGARGEATRPHEVRTEQWLAHRLEVGGPSPNVEPFTDIEWSMERDELHAAIDRIPFRRERELVRMVGLEGMAQSVAGAKFGIQQAAASKALASGFEMLRELLEIGSALDPRRLPATLETLGDSAQRDLIRLLYLDRVDLAEASQTLGVSPYELRARHRVALEAIKRTVPRP
ncbi:MAG: sigma-70 family RNA polymerase sigma factor [Myxococcales bacterium]|nr:sigma-70 family RNA polymerase sigma factor [Myxococcales bacterium]